MISRITTAAITAPVNATDAPLFNAGHCCPPRSSSAGSAECAPLAIAVSRLVRGLGQQEVLSRQNVHDVAFAIDQLDRMFEVTRPFQDRERTIHVNVRNCGSSL